jgi:hypothetical protein
VTDLQEREGGMERGKEREYEGESKRREEN